MSGLWGTATYALQKIVCPPYDLPDLKYYEREIIAAHVLIDLGKPLKFIPLLETYE